MNLGLLSSQTCDMKQTPSLHGGGANEAQSVAEEVLVVDDDSWRGSHSFFVGVTTNALWLSPWMMPFHEHTVSTNLSQRFIHISVHIQRT